MAKVKKKTKFVKKSRVSPKIVTIDGVTFRDLDAGDFYLEVLGIRDNEERQAATNLENGKNYK